MTRGNDSVRTCPATDCVVYPEAGDPAFSNVTPQTDVVLAVLLALALVMLTTMTFITLISSTGGVDSAGCAQYPSA